MHTNIRILIFGKIVPKDVNFLTCMKGPLPLEKNCNAVYGFTKMVYIEILLNFGN